MTITHTHSSASALVFDISFIWWQVEQLAKKSIAEVLAEPEGQRLRQLDFAHVDAEAPLSQAASEFLQTFLLQYAISSTWHFYWSMLAPSTAVV